MTKMNEMYEEKKHTISITGTPVGLWRNKAKKQQHKTELRERRKDPLYFQHRCAVQHRWKLCSRVEGELIRC